MKVKELIEKLQKCDPELECICEGFQSINTVSKLHVAVNNDYSWELQYAIYLDSTKFYNEDWLRIVEGIIVE